MTRNDYRRPARTEGETIDVLQVEDNPGDARFTREAFEQTCEEVDLTVVSTGAAALEHLDDEEAAIPALILLDLHLEELSGADVLRELHDDPELRRIPVVVFSGSTAREDVRRTYDLGANAYVPKPDDATGYFDAIERLVAFWLSTGALPPVETNHE